MRSCMARRSQIRPTEVGPASIAKLCPDRPLALTGRNPHHAQNNWIMCQQHCPLLGWDCVSICSRMVRKRANFWMPLGMKSTSRMRSGRFLKERIEALEGPQRLSLGEVLDIFIALKTCAGNSNMSLPSRYDADGPMSRATFNRVTYSVVEQAGECGTSAAAVHGPRPAKDRVNPPERTRV